MLKENKSHNKTNKINYERARHYETRVPFDT